MCFKKLKFICIKKIKIKIKNLIKQIPISKISKLTSMSEILNEEPQSELTEKTESHSDSSSNNSLPESRPKRLNKTQKKFAKYQRRLENYKLRKANKKQNKIQKALENVLEQNKNKETCVTQTETEASKESESKDNIKQNYDSFINKRELKRRINERLAKVYEDIPTMNESLKICIDCSFSDKMSQKEQSKLAQQIGRCYATNKAIEKPVHLTLCNLNKESKFYSELVRLHDGFERYSILITDKSIDTHYSTKLDTICYLSPDSKNHLEDVSAEKIYVIGGKKLDVFFKA